VAAFSPEWLALREPADHAARSADLTRLIADALAEDPAPRILDLAAGTGSNLRYLVGAIPQGRWLLVDHDSTLLARVPPGARIETREMNLATLDDRSIFEGRAFVTASALLDLVSEAWTRTLAARCAEVGAAVLFALSYDGRIVCSPEDPEDASIVALVNEHQRGDKGFGPALGPDATEVAARCFEAVGYRVRRASSDWVLQSESGELQRRLIDGWAQAAAEIAPDRARAIDGWRDRRLAHVAAAWSEITVGHEDFAGWPDRSNRGDH
jgi:hypothetical protein